MTAIGRYILHGIPSIVVLMLLAGPVVPCARGATNFILLGWSEDGMRFIDNDYSVFAIHPPGNIIHAQVVQLIGGNQAKLLTNAAAAGITVTYQAVGDPDGSTNSTSQGKSNFWDYDVPLFGTNLNADEGLGASMPGPANTPQPMTFTTDYNWFTAAGIPMTPYDDAGKFNPYPLLRLVAKCNGTPVTNIDIAVGMTDEMECRLCHASGASTGAMPVAGWIYEANPDRDYRLNILRLHDERQVTNAVYAPALAAAGYHSGGLLAQVLLNGQPVLCMKCHPSTLLPGSGYGTIKPLTQAIHQHHATVIDPRDGQVLDSETNRSTCYTCHGGELTHFLRGAMGTADSTSGQLAIQCQSCHGTMAMVGATNRIGWLSEPNCQACHVGDALATIGGQIRFTFALTNGVLRTPANDRFATDPNTPSNGLSLFHFSRGHANLVCSACHGPPHAEFPSAVNNDNLRSLQVQGHLGVMAECVVCHGAQDLSNVAGGGPHGMHPHDTDWADGSTGTHPNFATAGGQECGACHGPTVGGSDVITRRGTILSQARGDRAFSTGFGSKTFWRGRTIGCSQCHNPPSAPTAGNTATNTQAGVAVTFTLTSSTNSVRIVTQPANGLVGLSNKVATYTPAAGFVGTDVFTFASFKPQIESSLATGTVVVAEAFTVGDGIPDWWRKLHFGGDGMSTNGQSCATCDPDNDGQDNRQEYRAGTDPLDPRSLLRLFSVQTTGLHARVGFQTIVARRYALDATSNLMADAWGPVISNVWGRNHVLVLPATNGAAADRAVFRVRTQ